MRHRHPFRLAGVASAIVVSLSVAACGSTGSDASSTTTTADATTTTAGDATTTASDGDVRTLATTDLEVDLDTDYGNLYADGILPVGEKGADTQADHAGLASGPVGP